MNKIFSVFSLANAVTYAHLHYWVCVVIWLALAVRTVIPDRTYRRILIQTGFSLWITWTALRMGVSIGTIKRAIRETSAGKGLLRG